MNFGNPTKPGKRRIMVVAEPGREAAGALQWALSHAALENDEIILLHVDQVQSLKKSSTLYFWRGVATGNVAGSTVSLGSSSMGDMEGDFVEAMRAKCELMQPKVKVQVERLETEGKEKDKAAAILAQSVVHEVDLLIVGQQRRSLSLFG